MLIFTEGMRGALILYIKEHERVIFLIKKLRSILFKENIYFFNKMIYLKK